MTGGRSSHGLRRDDGSEVNGEVEEGIVLSGNEAHKFSRRAEERDAEREIKGINQPIREARRSKRRECARIDDGHPQLAIGVCAVWLGALLNLRRGWVAAAGVVLIASQIAFGRWRVTTNDDQRVDESQRAARKQ